MADYKVLDQTEQDDIIVGFLSAQERDQYCHQLNLERYDKMLTTLPDGKWKDRVAELRGQTADRLAEVTSIIKATETQLPPQARLDAAKQRIKR